MSLMVWLLSCSKLMREPSVVPASRVDRPGYLFAQDHAGLPVEAIRLPAIGMWGVEGRDPRRRSVCGASRGETPGSTFRFSRPRPPLRRPVTSDNRMQNLIFWFSRWVVLDECADIDPSPPARIYLCTI
jgi:hypothetical protein